MYSANLYPHNVLNEKVVGRMISILILTDELHEWEQKIRNCLQILRSRKTNVGYHLENQIFVVDIEDDVGCNRQRRRYSHIILDKPVHKDFETTIIRPLVSNPVIHTKRYLEILSTDIAK